MISITQQHLQFIFGAIGISTAIAALLMFYFEKGQTPHRVGSFILSLCFTPIIMIPVFMYLIWGAPVLTIVECGVYFIPGFFGTLFIWTLIKTFVKERAPEFDKVSDIRTLKMPRTMYNYNVFTYWRGNSIMIGLDVKTQKPIYIKQRDFDEMHVQLTGTTGSGKTVMVQMVGRQLVRKKLPFIVIDPKKDRYLMHVLYWAARKARVPYHYIDLSKGPQLNPFMDATPNEMTELMYAAFGLEQKGTDADHYRGKDRKGARLAAQLMSQMDVPSLLGVMDQVVNPEVFPEGFCSKFEELASLESINATTQGVDFESIVNKRGVIYIVGSTENPQIKAAQEMLTTKVNHMIKRREPGKKYPVATIFFDEFKSSCSKAAMTVFSTMRDKGLHAIMAHQSNLDFHDIPGISTAAIHGAVVDNTQLKIVYKVKDVSTVQEFADMSGYKTVYQATRKPGEKQPTYTEMSANLIEQNHIHRLNRGLAVCFGATDIATIIGTSPQKVRYHKKALRVEDLELATSPLELTPVVTNKPTLRIVGDEFLEDV